MKFMVKEGSTIKFDYINWRGEKSTRSVLIFNFTYGSNEWHTQPQWLLYGYDNDKCKSRFFAMRDMSNVVIVYNK